MLHRRLAPRQLLALLMWLLLVAPPMAAAQAPAADGWSRDDAAHLLRRAGFGGTPQQIDRLHALGRTAAVDYLIDGKLPDGAAAPITATGALENFTPAGNDVLPSRELARKLREEIRKAGGRDKAPPELRQRLRREIQQKMRDATREEMTRLTSWWVHRMVHTDRPLDEKMALFWHGLFTSAVREVRNPIFMQRQNVLYHDYATGNYKQLTQAVVHDAAMLRYLNADQNTKGKPNENLARELMELFTMGEGNGYTEQDIKEVARALTGLSVLRDEGAGFRPRAHDTGEKTIFGKTGNYGPDDVVELIFQQPQPADYLAKRLWQYFGRPEPTPEEIAPVAAALRSSNYEVKPALRALFTSDAFYGEAAKFTLIKSPIELMVETARNLEAPIDRRQSLAVAGAARQMGQALFQPPNVRGWPGGEYWITSATLFVRYNTVCTAVDGTYANPGREGKGNKAAKLLQERKNKNKNKKNKRNRGMAGNVQQIALEEASKPAKKEKPEPGAGSIKKLFPALDNEAKAGEVVDAAIARFLQRPLHPVKRDALVKLLGEDGTVTFGDPKEERNVRTMLGLLMSTPEYQVH